MQPLESYGESIKKLRQSGKEHLKLTQIVLFTTVMIPENLLYAHFSGDDKYFKFLIQRIKEEKGMGIYAKWLQKWQEI